MKTVTFRKTFFGAVYCRLVPFGADRQLSGLASLDAACLGF
jgi:hypothetical protein